LSDRMIEEDFATLPGGPSPRWVSGEKYDRAYAHANRLSRKVADLTLTIKRMKAACPHPIENVNGDGTVTCGVCETTYADPLAGKGSDVA
jgi:hypothetical protein